MENPIISKTGASFFHFIKEASFMVKRESFAKLFLGAQEVCDLLCFSLCFFLFSARSFLVSGFSFFGIHIPRRYDMRKSALIIFEVERARIRVEGVVRVDGFSRVEMQNWTALLGLEQKRALTHLLRIVSSFFKASLFSYQCSNCRASLMPHHLYSLC